LPSDGFTLILAEAGVETIPRELWRHPSIKRYARKRGKPPRQLLLDASMHHQALRRLPGHEYRGRPDITHVALLVALDAPACARGNCRPIIATTAGKTIHVRHDARLPRSYPRFTGLLEQLLAEGAVPPGSGNPLLRLEELSLEELLERHRPAIITSQALPAASPTTLEAAAEAVESSGAALIPATPRAAPTPRLLEAAGRVGLPPHHPEGARGHRALDPRLPPTLHTESPPSGGPRQALSP